MSLVLGIVSFLAIAALMWAIYTDNDDPKAKP